MSHKLNINEKLLVMPKMQIFNQNHSCIEFEQVNDCSNEKEITKIVASLQKEKLKKGVKILNAVFKWQDIIRNFII